VVGKAGISNQMHQGGIVINALQYGFAGRPAEARIAAPQPACPALGCDECQQKARSIGVLQLCLRRPSRELLQVWR
jgi:hypothetical protein